MWRGVVRLPGGGRGMRGGGGPRVHGRRGTCAATRSARSASASASASASGTPTARGAPTATRRTAAAAAAGGATPRTRRAAPHIGGELAVLGQLLDPTALV